MALPSMEPRNIFMHEEPLSSTKVSGSLCPPEKIGEGINSQNPITTPKISTPESQKKQVFSLDLDLQETYEKTPDAALKSPASVLNPPSSLRKTIRDYFLATS